jgi:serine/threonine protein kinase
VTPSVDPAITHGPLGPGTRVGRYQILRRLATGGMAELYLARHVGAAGYQKVVALKRVRPHLAEDQQFVARFLNEARLAAGLDHSSIAHVIDFGVEGGEHFMAMEYVHGRSVMQLLQQFERCPLPLACGLLIVRDVAAALHHAHERRGPDGRPLGLVHRDVSPSNVLVSFDGDVKLVDFGIAKATAEGSATRTGTILGKLSYMAPEQLRGQRIDRRSDVFALGALAYELMTGVRCFYAEGEFALINRVVAARFERPSAVVEGFPAALEAILARSLAADPDARWADARELQLALEGFAATAGHSLSKLELAEHMRACFGDEPYPRTDVVPLPTEAVVSTTEASASMAPTPVGRTGRRSPAAWVGVALVTGLVVGLVTREWLGDDEPAPVVAPELGTGERESARAPAVAEVGADPPSKVEPSTRGDAPDAHAGESSPSTSSPAATPERRSRGRAPTRRRSSGSPVTPTDPSRDATLRDFLPPSRRKDE